MLPFSWKPGMQQKGNLKGTYRTLDGMDGDTQTQTWVADTKKGEKLKLEDGLLATDGWTFIDDSQGLLFDNDKDWDWVKERPANGGQDWYFMAYGHDYKAALKDYTLFAGKVPLPPRYAFGYWWSRYWLYSDKEFRNLIDNFHTYQIPLDVLVVDMDWHYTEQGKGGWTGWTWNRDLFPNPKGFLGYLKQNDVKITLNLHPADGVASYEEKYPELAKDMGVDPQSKQTIPWINSDKKFIKNMFKNVLTPMEKDGVDFWWLDWQQGIYDPKMKNLSNTWWINYAFSVIWKRTGIRVLCCTIVGEVWEIIAIRSVFQVMRLYHGNHWIFSLISILRLLMYCMVIGAMTWADISAKVSIRKCTLAGCNLEL